MKNILIIATFFPPAGGIGTFRVTKYVKYLKKYNWQPTVITINEKNITNYDDSLVDNIDKDVEIHRLELDTKRYKKIEKAFYKAIKKNICNIISSKKYDAIFITGGPFEPLKIAPYIYRKFKIPYIIDLRDPWKLQKISTRTNIIKLKSKVKRILIGFKERKIFKNAFAICTVNETMTKEYIKEYPKYEKKFYTISNGYDPIDYENLTPKKLSDFSIIYAGKFKVSAGFRNPTNLFKAINIVNARGINTKFIHVGPKDEDVINNANQEGIINYCMFLGEKAYKETLEICKAAEILIVIGGTEKNEQTGKIFDYIGCKKPIIAICNKDSEIRTVAQKVKNMYCIEKENIEDMVNTIIKIYDNKNTNEIIDEITEFTREELTSQLVKILENINKE